MDKDLLVQAIENLSEEQKVILLSKLASYLDDMYDSAQELIDKGASAPKVMGKLSIKLIADCTKLLLEAKRGGVKNSLRYIRC